MSKHTATARAAMPTEANPLVSIAQIMAKLHEYMQSAHATASATKRIFDTCCVLEIDCDAVMPLLEAGATISDNQATVLCEISDMFYGVERIVAGCSR